MTPRVSCAGPKSARAGAAKVREGKRRGAEGGYPQPSMPPPKDPSDLPRRPRGEAAAHEGRGVRGAVARPQAIARQQRELVRGPNLRTRRVKYWVMEGEMDVRSRGVRRRLSTGRLNRVPVWTARACAFARAV